MELHDRIAARGPTRPGRLGFPVLLKLLDAYAERGDAEAAVLEPAPAVVDDEPEWWEHAYAGGPMVKVPGFPRPLYPPDASAKGKTPSVDGPDVVAYKRTVSRAGRWPWQTFDDTYGNGFAHGKSGNVSETGVAGVQRQQSIDPTGWIGEQTFNTLRSIRVPEGRAHAGEMAMDATAANLIEQAWQRFKGSPSGGQLADVERAITDYLVRSIAAEPKWHYSQARPMSNLGKSPDVEQTADCSTQSTSAYFWARQQTGVAVPDPNGNGYNGYGWTGELADNPHVSAPYEVGDLALYGDSPGDTSHVCTCYLAGDASSSEWCSHGSEAAPYPVDLHYRSDLLFVVRPGLMP